MKSFTSIPSSQKYQQQQLQQNNNTKVSATIQTNLISNSDLNTTHLQNEGATFIQEDGDTSMHYYNPQKSQSTERQQLKFGAVTREQSQVKCVFELQHDDDEEFDQSGNRSLLDDTRKFYSNIKRSNNNSAKKYKVNNILQQKGGGGIDDQNYHTFSNNMYNTISSAYANSTNPNLNSQLYNMPSNMLQHSQNQGNMSLFHSTNNNSFNQYFDKSPPRIQPPFVNPYFFPKKYIGSGASQDFSNNSTDFRKELGSQNSTQNVTAPFTQYSDFLIPQRGNSQQLNISYSNYLGGITSASQRNTYFNNNANSKQNRMHYDSYNHDNYAKFPNGMKRPSSKLLSQVSDQHHYSNVLTQASYTHSKKQLHSQLPLQAINYFNQNQSLQKYNSDKKCQSRSHQSQSQDERSILKSSLLSQLKDDSQQLLSEEDNNEYQRQQFLSNSYEKNGNIFKKQFSKESSNMHENDLDDDVMVMNIIQENKENIEKDINQQYSSLHQSNFEQGSLMSSKQPHLNNLFDSNPSNIKRQSRFQITDFIEKYNKTSRLKILGVKNYEKYQEHDIFFHLENPAKEEEEEVFFNTATKQGGKKEFTKEVISPGREFQNLENSERLKEKISSKRVSDRSNKENQKVYYTNPYTGISEQDPIKGCSKTLFSEKDTNQYRKSPEKDSVNSSTKNEDRVKQLFSFSKPENKIQQQKQQIVKNQAQNRVNTEGQYKSNQNNSLKFSSSNVSSNQVYNSQQFSTFSPSKRIQGIIQEVSQQSLQNGCPKCNQEYSNPYLPIQNQNNCKCRSTLQTRNKESIISNDSVFFIDLKKNNQSDNLSSVNHRTYEAEENPIQDIDLDNQQAYSISTSKENNSKYVNNSPSKIQNYQQQMHFYNPYLNEQSERQNQPTPTLNNYHKSQHSTERRDYLNCLEPKNKFQNERIKKNINMPRQQQSQYSKLNKTAASTISSRTVKKSQQDYSFNKSARPKSIDNDKRVRSKTLIEKISKNIISKEFITYILQSHASCCRNFRKELNKSLN